MFYDRYFENTHCNEFKIRFTGSYGIIKHHAKFLCMVQYVGGQTVAKIRV